MASANLTDSTINAIYTFDCGPVHAAWINELTTPIATWIAFLELSDGRLVKVAPCEVDIDPTKYPSLGIEADVCDRGVLQYEAYGKTHHARPLDLAKHVLPLRVVRINESDPLKEGAVSELEIVGTDQSIIFRHIMPPMTLGIDCKAVGASNKSLERTRQK